MMNLACYFNHRRKWTASLSQDSVCIQWKLSTPDQLAFSHHQSFAHKDSFFSTTELSTCSKEISAFKRQNSWTDPFRKLARHLSHQSFLSFCKLQFFTKYAWRTDMLRFLSPVSTVSTRNAWNHDSPFGVHTHKINEKKKKRLHF